MLHLHSLGQSLSLSDVQNIPGQPRTAMPTRGFDLDAR
jgi:hypothetical protein